MRTPKPTAAGLALIELIVVLAIAGLSLGLVGPRIGAGMTRLEIRQTEQSLRSFVRMARTRARRSGRAHFVVLEREGRRMVLLDPDMRILRERELPASVEFLPPARGGLGSIQVPPSGLIRHPTVPLGTRLGTVQVSLE